MRNEALKYARSHRDHALNDLKDLLRIPSISTLPKHKADVQQAAQWLADKLAGIGLDNAQVMPTPGHPVVYADWLHAGPDASTLLIYGHYDVQPVDPLDEWDTPPFEPTIKGDKIFARGAADDKGQTYIHIAAAEAYLEAAGKLPLNLKFMIEGEEESGCEHLEDFVLENKALLEADAALISDNHIIDPDTPVLITGVRGLVYTEITMRGSRKDLHSGLYGGLVENPLNAMAKLLAALRDEQGRVNIPGFYEDVRELAPAEREALNRGPITAERILAETGAPALWGEAGYTPVERKGARPTLDVHGIKGGFTGEGAKTVIPAVAKAKVSMRLATDQDPSKIARLFSEHILRISPNTMEVEVDILSYGDSATIDMSAPAIEAAAAAYEQVFGRRPLYLREGGTIPVVALFVNEMKIPVAMMGFGLPDDGLHAPNEKFHLPNFYRGIETAIHYYDILAKQG